MLLKYFIEIITDSSDLQILDCLFDGYNCQKLPELLNCLSVDYNILENYYVDNDLDTVKSVDNFNKIKLVDIQSISTTLISKKLNFRISILIYKETIELSFYPDLIEKDDIESIFNLINTIKVVVESKIITISPDFDHKCVLFRF